MKAFKRARVLLFCLWTLVGLLGGVSDGLATEALPFHKPDVPPGEDDPLASRPGEPGISLEEYSLPDLQTIPPVDLQLLKRWGGKRALRFSNSIWNRGAGALEVRGVFDPKTNQVEVSQVLFGPDEEAEISYVGNFAYHPAHSHWHWLGFSVYQIWSVSFDGRLGKKLIDSGKVGYCMIDNNPVAAELVKDLDLDIPTRQQYALCHWRKQGISPGWMDTYKRHLEGQSLDITDLSDGLYALRSTVNPDGIILEADRTNNSAVVYFRLREDKMVFMGTTVNESILRNRNR